MNSNIEDWLYIKRRQDIHKIMESYNSGGKVNFSISDDLCVTIIGLQILFVKDIKNLKTGYHYYVDTMYDKDGKYIEVSKDWQELGDLIKNGVVFIEVVDGWREYIEPKY